VNPSRMKGTPFIKFAATVSILMPARRFHADYGHVIESKGRGRTIRLTGRFRKFLLLDDQIRKALQSLALLIRALLLANEVGTSAWRGTVEVPIETLLLGTKFETGFVFTSSRLP